jgi:hypothetical protein
MEDQLKRFESDNHLLHREVHSGEADGELAKKEALRLLGDAEVYWRKTLIYLDELTDPDIFSHESSQELREQCSKMESVNARVARESSRLSDLAGLLSLQNQMLQEQLSQERRNRKQLEREFEKMGREDFSRLVEPFLTKGMFQKHAKR